MKQGNQFYFDVQITDSEGNILTNEHVEKIVFYVSNVKKEYTSTSEDVIYDSESKCFKVWLKEEDTLNLEDYIDLDARILFDTNEILGCYIRQEFFNPMLVKESILDEDESDDTDENEPSEEVI